METKKGDGDGTKTDKSVWEWGYFEGSWKIKLKHSYPIIKLEIHTWLIKLTCSLHIYQTNYFNSNTWFGLEGKTIIFINTNLSKSIQTT